MSFFEKLVEFSEIFSAIVCGSFYILCLSSVWFVIFLEITMYVLPFFFFLLIILYLLKLYVVVRPTFEQWLDKFTSYLMFTNISLFDDVESDINLVSSTARTQDTPFVNFLEYMRQKHFSVNILLTELFVVIWFLNLSFFPNFQLFINFLFYCYAFFIHQLEHIIYFIPSYFLRIYYTVAYRYGHKFEQAYAFYDRVFFRLTHWRAKTVLYEGSFFMIFASVHGVLKFMLFLSIPVFFMFFYFGGVQHFVQGFDQVFVETIQEFYMRATKRSYLHHLKLIGDEYVFFIDKIMEFCIEEVTAFPLTILGWLLLIFDFLYHPQVVNVMVESWMATVNSFVTAHIGPIFTDYDQFKLEIDRKIWFYIYTFEQWVYLQCEEVGFYLIEQAYKQIDPFLAVIVFFEHYEALFIKTDFYAECLYYANQTIYKIISPGEITPHLILIVFVTYEIAKIIAYFINRIYAWVIRFFNFYVLRYFVPLYKMTLMYCHRFVYYRRFWVSSIKREHYVLSTLDKQVLISMQADIFKQVMKERPAVPNATLTSLMPRVKRKRKLEYLRSVKHQLKQYFGVDGVNTLFLSLYTMDQRAHLLDIVSESTVDNTLLKIDDKVHALYSYKLEKVFQKNVRNGNSIFYVYKTSFIDETDETFYFTKALKTELVGLNFFSKYRIVVKTLANRDENYLLMRWDSDKRGLNIAKAVELERAIQENISARFTQKLKQKKQFLKKLDQAYKQDPFLWVADHRQASPKRIYLYKRGISRIVWWFRLYHFAANTITEGDYIAYTAMLLATQFAEFFAIQNRLWKRWLHRDFRTHNFFYIIPVWYFKNFFRVIRRNLRRFARFVGRTVNRYRVLRFIVWVFSIPIQYLWTHYWLTTHIRSVILNTYFAFKFKVNQKIKKSKNRGWKVYIIFRKMLHRIRLVLMRPFFLLAVVLKEIFSFIKFGLLFLEEHYNTYFFYKSFSFWYWGWYVFYFLKYFGKFFLKPFGVLQFFLDLHEQKTSILLEMHYYALGFTNDRYQLYLEKKFATSSLNKNVISNKFFASYFFVSNWYNFIKKLFGYEGSSLEWGVDEFGFYFAAKHEKLYNFLRVAERVDQLFTESDFWTHRSYAMLFFRAFFDVIAGIYFFVFDIFYFIKNNIKSIKVQFKLIEFLYKRELVAANAGHKGKFILDLGPLYTNVFFMFIYYFICAFIFDFTQNAERKKRFWKWWYGPGDDNAFMRGLEKIYLALLDFLEIFYNLFYAYPVLFFRRFIFIYHGFDFYEGRQHKYEKFQNLIIWHIVARFYVMFRYNLFRYISILEIKFYDFIDFQRIYALAALALNKYVFIFASYYVRKFLYDGVMLLNWESTLFLISVAIEEFFERPLSTVKRGRKQLFLFRDKLTTIFSVQKAVFSADAFFWRLVLKKIFGISSIFTDLIGVRYIMKLLWPFERLKKIRPAIMLRLYYTLDVIRYYNSVFAPAAYLLVVSVLFYKSLFSFEPTIHLFFGYFFGVLYVYPVFGRFLIINMFFTGWVSRFQSYRATLIYNEHKSIGTGVLLSLFFFYSWRWQVFFGPIAHHTSLYSLRETPLVLKLIKRGYYPANEDYYGNATHEEALMFFLGGSESTGHRDRDTDGALLSNNAYTKFRVDPTAFFETQRPRLPWRHAYQEEEIIVDRFQWPSQLDVIMWWQSSGLRIWRHNVLEFLSSTSYDSHFPYKVHNAIDISSSCWSIFILGSTLGALYLATYFYLSSFTLFEKITIYLYANSNNFGIAGGNYNYKPIKFDRYRLTALLETYKPKFFDPNITAIFSSSLSFRQKLHINYAYYTNQRWWWSSTANFYMSSSFVPYGDSQVMGINVTMLKFFTHFIKQVYHLDDMLTLSIFQGFYKNEEISCRLNYPITVYLKQLGLIQEKHKFIFYSRLNHVESQVAMRRRFFTRKNSAVRATRVLLSKWIFLESLPFDSKALKKIKLSHVSRWRRGFWRTKRLHKMPLDVFPESELFSFAVRSNITRKVLDHFTIKKYREDTQFKWHKFDKRTYRVKRRRRRRISRIHFFTQFFVPGLSSSKIRKNFRSMYMKRMGMPKYTLLRHKVRSTSLDFAVRSGHLWDQYLTAITKIFLNNLEYSTSYSEHNPYLKQMFYAPLNFLDRGLRRGSIKRVELPVGNAKKSGVVLLHNVDRILPMLKKVKYISLRRRKRFLPRRQRLAWVLHLSRLNLAAHLEYLFQKRIFERWPTRKLRMQYPQIPFAFYYRFKLFEKLPNTVITAYFIYTIFEKRPPPMRMFVPQLTGFTLSFSLIRLKGINWVYKFLFCSRQFKRTRRLFLREAEQNLFTLQVAVANRRTFFAKYFWYIDSLSASHRMRRLVNYSLYLPVFKALLMHYTVERKKFKVLYKLDLSPLPDQFIISDAKMHDAVNRFAWQVRYPKRKGISHEMMAGLKTKILINDIFTVAGYSFNVGNAFSRPDFSDAQYDKLERLLRKTLKATVVDAVTNKRVKVQDGNMKKKLALYNQILKTRYNRVLRLLNFRSQRFRKRAAEIFTQYADETKPEHYSLRIAINMRILPGTMLSTLSSKWNWLGEQHQAWEQRQDELRDIITNAQLFYHIYLNDFYKTYRVRISDAVDVFPFFLKTRFLNKKVNSFGFFLEVGTQHTRRVRAWEKRSDAFYARETKPFFKYMKHIKRRKRSRKFMPVVGVRLRGRGRDMQDEGFFKALVLGDVPSHPALKVSEWTRLKTSYWTGDYESLIIDNGVSRRDLYLPLNRFVASYEEYGYKSGPHAKWMSLVKFKKFYHLFTRSLVFSNGREGQHFNLAQFYLLRDDAYYQNGVNLKYALKRYKKMGDLDQPILLNFSVSDKYHVSLKKSRSKYAWSRQRRLPLLFAIRGARGRRRFKRSKFRNNKVNNLFDKTYAIQLFMFDRDLMSFTNSFEERLVKLYYKSNYFLWNDKNLVRDQINADMARVLIKHFFPINALNRIYMRRALLRMLRMHNGAKLSGRKLVEVHKTLQRSGLLDFRKVVQLLRNTNENENVQIPRLSFVRRIVEVGSLNFSSFAYLLDFHFKEAKSSLQEKVVYARKKILSLFFEQVLEQREVKKKKIIIPKMQPLVGFFLNVERMRLISQFRNDRFRYTLNKYLAQYEESMTAIKKRFRTYSYFYVAMGFTNSKGLFAANWDVKAIVDNFPPIFSQTPHVGALFKSSRHYKNRAHMFNPRYSGKMVMASRANGRRRSKYFDFYHNKVYNQTTLTRLDTLVGIGEAYRTTMANSPRILRNRTETHKLAVLEKNYYRYLFKNYSTKRLHYKHPRSYDLATAAWQKVKGSTRYVRKRRMVHRMYNRKKHRYFKTRGRTVLVPKNPALLSNRYFELIVLQRWRRPLVHEIMKHHLAISSAYLNVKVGEIPIPMYQERAFYGYYFRFFKKGWRKAGTKKLKYDIYATFLSKALKYSLYDDYMGAGRRHWPQTARYMHQIRNRNKFYERQPHSYHRTYRLLVKRNRYYMLHRRSWGLSRRAMMRRMKVFKKRYPEYAERGLFRHTYQVHGMQR